MAAEGVDIGALSGRVEFEDNVSKTLDLILGRIDQMDGKFQNLDGTIAKTAAGVFAGEAIFRAFAGAVEIAATTLADMTIEGGGMADVVDNFDHLTSSAGRLGSTLLNELKAGTHNTIEDLELIKIVNKDLAAGMNLTDAQFRTMADGAFALAQATGGDVASSLETMNDAMLTGRTRSIQMLTGKIDLTKAEEEFAKKLGVSKEHLTEEGRLFATREAILASVTAATERLGEQTDGIDEKANQAQVAWKNMYNELAMSIATSPEISEAFDAIKGALVDAFGGNKEAMIRNITGAVADFADGVGKYGPPVIEFFGDLVDKGSALIQMGGISDWFREKQDAVTGLTLLLQGYSVAEAEAMIAATRAGEAAAAAAKDAARYKAEVEGTTESVKKKTAAEEREAEIMQRNKLIMAETAEEMKKRAEAMKEIKIAAGGWHDILKAMDATMVLEIEHYLEAGVAQDKLATAYGLTAVQIGAVVKSMKESADAAKLEEKQIIDSTARWAEYNAIRMAASGTATDQLISDIERWRAAQIKSHQAAKTDTVDFYTWLNAQSREMVNQEEQLRLEADTHSKAHFQRIAADAKDAYQFATQHADQFTSEYIESLRRASAAAQDAALNWRSSIGGALGDFIDQANELSKAMAFSFDVNSGNFASALESAAANYHGGTGVRVGNKFSTAGGEELARKGYSFQEIIDILMKGGSTVPPPPKGPRIPGFREGGIGEFGEGTLAMLHGKEAIIPLDRMGALGGVTNIFHVNGTARDTAREIGSILMDQLRARRYLPSAG